MPPHLALFEKNLGTSWYLHALSIPFWKSWSVQKKMPQKKFILERDLSYQAKKATADKQRGNGAENENGPLF